MQCVFGIIFALYACLGSEFCLEGEDGVCLGGGGAFSRVWTLRTELVLQAARYDQSAVSVLKQIDRLLKRNQYLKKELVDLTKEAELLKEEWQTNLDILHKRAMQHAQSGCASGGGGAR